MIMTFSFQCLSDFVKQVYYIPDYARLGRVLQRPPKESFIDWWSRMFTGRMHFLSLKQQWHYQVTDTCMCGVCVWVCLCVCVCVVYVWCVCVFIDTHADTFMQQFNNSYMHFICLASRFSQAASWHVSQYDCIAADILVTGPSSSLLRTSGTACHPASQTLGTFRRRLKTHLFAVSPT